MVVILKMTKLSYWERRHLQTKAKQIQNTEDYERALQPQLNKLYHELDAEMSYWVSRYAKNQAIEPLEARKLLQNVNTKHWELTLKQFEEKARAGGHESELDAEYFKSRVARLQDLERQLQQTAMPYAKDTQKSLGNALVGQYDDTYMRTTFNIQAQKAKFTSNFARFNDNQMKIAVSMPWAKDGKDFSSRVWKDYTKELPSYLMDSVLRGTLLGYSPQRISKMFHARFQDARRNDIHRLVVSEMAHVAEEANAASYEENEIDQYEYMATLESHTCSICGRLDGQVFTMKERRPGVNYPTIHSRCRCTTVPYMEGLPDVNSRWYRNPETGKGKLTRNMKFDEWKKLVNSGKPMPEVTPLKPRANVNSSGINPLDPNKWPEGIKVVNTKAGKMFDVRAADGRFLGKYFLEDLDTMSVDLFKSNYEFDMTSDRLNAMVKWIQNSRIYREGVQSGKIKSDVVPISPDKLMPGVAKGKVMSVDEADRQHANPKHDGETPQKRANLTAARSEFKKIQEDYDAQYALTERLRKEVREEHNRNNPTVWDTFTREETKLNNMIDKYNYYVRKINRSETNAKPYRINCQRCAPTYELRRRGYDVIALPNKGMNHHDTYTIPAEMWRNADGTVSRHEMLNATTTIQVDKVLTDRMQIGERGTLDWVWQKGKSGHIINVEMTKDGLLVVDSQSGITRESFAEYMGDNQFLTSWHGDKIGVNYNRVDDKAFDLDHIGIIVKGASAND